MESDISHFSQKGEILLCGDINTRTGKYSDTVESEGNRFISEDLNWSPNNEKPRLSFDNVINQHGKTLLNICKSQNIKILNGRIPGDSLGKPTFHGHNGVSVVDYVILSQSLFDITSYFVVSEPTYLSDHSQITVWLSKKKSTQFSPKRNKETNFTSNLKRTPNQFLWEEGSKQRFQQALTSDESSRLISEFLSSNFSLNKFGANNALTLFENILITAAKQSLRIKTRKHRYKNKNCLNKKWFDKECNIYTKSKMKTFVESKTQGSFEHFN